MSTGRQGRHRRRCAARSCSAARDDDDLVAQLEELAAAAADGTTPPSVVPDSDTLAAPVRVAIDYADAADLAAKAGKAVQAFRSGSPALWKMLRAQGVFVGRGPAPKVAFLYTGQGSQYVNMLKDAARRRSRSWPTTFAEADRIMTPLLGRTAVVVHLHRRHRPRRRP